MVTGLQSVQDPGERAAAAVALIGTPLEDLYKVEMDAFLSALSGGADAMVGFEGAADRMGETLSDNTSTDLEVFKRSVQTGLVDALGASVSWISENSTLLTQLGIVAGVTAIALTGIGLAQGAVAAGGFVNWLKASAAATWLLNSALLANPLTWVAIGIAAVVAAVIIMWNKWEGFRNFITAAWEAIKIAISFAWESVIKPVFDFFAAAVRVAGDVVMWLWHNVIDPAFAAIGFVFQLWWAGVQIVWAAFKIALDAAGGVVLWLWHTIFEPAFAAIGAVVSFWWNNIVSPVWGLFTAALGFAGDKVTWLWQTIISPAFEGIKSVISGAWDFIRPIFDNIGIGIEAVGTISGRVGDAMRNAFSGVVDVLKAPIHAIGSLLANVPSSVLGVDIPGADSIRSWGATLQALAGGGVIASRDRNGLLSGPGTATSDSILGVNAAGVPIVRVATGEGVVNAWAMEHGGAELVARLNAGWVPPAALLHAMVPGLAAGGVIGGKVTRDQFLDQLRGIEGAEYVFGGWGNGWLTDCSGAVAKASNLIAYGDTETGGRFGTANMAEALAARGALPGLGGLDDYNVGWMNGGPGGGHAASTVPGGIGYEMGGPGGDGQFGGTAQNAGAALFTDHAHFPASMFVSTAAAAPQVNTATPQYQAPTTYSDGSSSLATSAANAPAQQQRLKTFEELGQDFGGIFAKGLLETFGLEDSILADPNKLLQGDDGSSVRTSGAAPGTAQQPAGQTLAAPGPTSGMGTGDPLLVGALASLGMPLEWIKHAGLFDTGGWLPPNGIAVSMLKQPEPLLPSDKWAVAEGNITAADRLVRTMSRGGGAGGSDGRIANEIHLHGYTQDDLITGMRREQWRRTGGYSGRSW
jgi:hypothetical protein